jgi:maltooligosyltrehalose synthase
MVVIIVPRLLAALSPEGRPLGAPLWRDTWIEVPAAHLHNRLTGELLTAEDASGRHLLCAADLLQRFPVALLSQENDHA